MLSCASVARAFIFLKRSIKKNVTIKVVYLQDISDAIRGEEERGGGVASASNDIKAVPFIGEDRESG
jgi:hypothetical protein